MPQCSGIIAELRTIWLKNVETTSAHGGARQLTQFSLDSKILSDPKTLGPFARRHEPLSRDRFSLARNRASK